MMRKAAACLLLMMVSALHAAVVNCPATRDGKKLTDAAFFEGMSASDRRMLIPDESRVEGHDWFQSWDVTHAVQGNGLQMVCEYQGVKAGLFIEVSEKVSACTLTKKAGVVAVGCKYMLHASSASTSFVVFNDPVMGFTFSYPDDFQSLPSAEPLLQQAAGCIVIPLRLKGKFERPYERILVNEIDYDCLRSNTPDVGSLTKSTENDLMNVYGHLEMTEPRNFLLDGHPAAFITAKAEVSGPMNGLEAGMILYGAQTCVLLDHRVACWNVLSSDQARLSSLLSGKVAFKGRPGQAWIPLH
jgi:hypothetical protein